MNLRGLVVTIVLLASLAAAGWAEAQGSRGTMTLAERLNQLRKGWSELVNPDDSGEQPPHAAQARQQGPTSGEPQRLAALPQSSDRTVAAGGTAANRYPRVNSGQILPGDYANMRRRVRRQESKEAPGDTAAEGPAKSTRTATLPRSTAPDSTDDHESKRRSLGDAYLDAPHQSPRNRTSRRAPNPFKSSSATESSSATSDSTATTRPSPTTRRSPRWTRPDDFNPATLRRDLIDSNGRSLAEANEAEQKSSTDPPQQGESSSTVADQSQPAQTIDEAQPPPAASDLATGRAPVQLGEPERADLDDSSDQSLTPLGSPPAALDKNAANSGPDAQTPHDDADDPSAQSLAEDTRRVQDAGQQAFAESDQSPAEKDDSEPVSENPQADAHGPATTEMPSDSARGRETFQSGLPGVSLDETVLVTNQMPMITSHVSGPRQILIGREAVYQLRLGNQSKTAADQVVAQVKIPEWAEVTDTAASSGIVQLDHEASEPNTFRWQLHRLAPHGSETLDVKLIPRSSQPLELEVDWSYAPTGARAVVEVQEPKLRMQVSGPDEVLYGKPQLYRLTLANPGTGTAENVEIHLLPPGGGDETVSSHFVGELASGSSKSVEVELTAREAGQLFVKASATAAGDISANADKEIFCRKPELEVDWRGPEEKYAGTAATYYFRVRNPGTAPASGVSVNVQLPAGTEFLSASEGQVYDPDDATVSWNVGTLRPGDDYYMELKCRVNEAGANAFDIEAAASEGDLVDAKIAETNVIALADLKLEATDPKGPIPVGQEAVYEIRVRNRGSNVAEDVNIVALFSEGIDAEAVEGAQYSITDGRVTFRTIEKLDAGREVVLKIRARAKTPGTHVFRAEVLCRELEIKLAAEETTRFFQDGVLGGTAAGPADSADRSGMFDETDSDSGRY